MATSTACRELQQLAGDSDLLVHDMALPERQVPHGHLHAKPSQVARTASLSRMRALLLTHVMPELGDKRDAAEAVIRRTYPGPLRWASDLLELEVTGRGGRPRPERRPAPAR